MKVVLILFLAALVSSCSQTTIYLVRHAEKETGAGSMMSTDPPLTQQGKERAEALAKLLQPENIIAIYSTNYTRTQNTARPLATLKQLPLLAYSDGNKLLDSLVGNGKGKYLVVGHSNTIPSMLRHLGLEPSMHEIADDDYDNLFIITLKNKKPSLEQKTYGAASPNP